MIGKLIAAVTLLGVVSGSAAAAPAVQPGAIRNILIMGTSTTAGAGASPITNRYVDLIKAARPADVYTELAISGSTLVNANPALSWENRAIPENHKIVIMQFGLNDWDTGVPVATFREQALAFVERVRVANPYAQLYWLSPWIKQYTVTSLPDVRGNRWQEFGMAIETAMRSVQGTHIDLDPTGSRRAAVPYSSGEPSGLHYNNAGHRKIADAVLAYI